MTVSINRMFRGDEPTELNACVGDNGQPSYYEYSEGFAEAARILIGLVVKNETSFPVDHMIYPIAFNIRHSVELRLKAAINDLSSVRKERSMPFFNCESTHDISFLWRYFRDQANFKDQRYKIFLNKIEPYISDIASIDSTGQTFRYPLSNESKKHLVETGNINILTLGICFEELNNFLKDMGDLNERLLEEYSQGTYTKNLSRDDLCEISRKLPNRRSWSSNDFSVCKEKIKKRFDIGSKEFSEAINIIKLHFEFSRNIGLTLPLLKASDNEVYHYFECLLIIHPLEKYKPREYENVNLAEVNIASVREYIERSDNALVKCLKLISPSSLGDISAIYDFSRDLDYSEKYRKISSKRIDQWENIAQSNPTKYKQDVSDYLKKSNAYEFLLKGLARLGHNDLAWKIIDDFGMTNYFDWFDKIPKDSKGGK